MRSYLLTTAAAAALALAMNTGASAAGWDGADDLPTSPLACDASAPAAPAAKPYDGGKAVTRPTRPARRSRWSTCRS